MSSASASVRASGFSTNTLFPRSATGGKRNLRVCAGGCRYVDDLDRVAGYGLSPVTVNGGLWELSGATRKVRAGVGGGNDFEVAGRGVCPGTEKSKFAQADNAYSPRRFHEQR